MPFLKGEPLDKCLTREGKLSPAEVLRIGREIAEGLAAAHERGLIHRDIKPANVWLEGDKRRVKILDFGLARADDDAAHLTQSGAIIGTPAYMAPEQAKGEEVDHRCDLFSLGSLLYRTCAGVLPFKGADTISTLMAVATENPPTPHALHPSIPLELSDIVMHLLEKRACERPMSAQAVATTLATLAQGGTAEPNLRANFGRNTRRGATKARSRWLTATALGLFALAPLLWWVSTVILRVETEDGTLIVEIKDDKVEARYKNGKLILTGPDGKDRYTLAPNERSKILDAGPYKIRVEGADGLTLDTSEFTLRKNGEATVRVTLEPKLAVAKKEVPGSEPKDADKGTPPKKSPIVFNEAAARDILNRIIKSGGQAGVAHLYPTEHGSWRAFETSVKPFTNVSALSLDELRRPLGVRLYKKTGFTDKEMQQLGQLTIWDLAIDDLAITDEGLKCLDQLRDLRVLRLNRLPLITDASLARLEGLVELRHLYCFDVHVTDDALKHVAKLPKLAAVTLNRTLVTPNGLANLKDGTALRNLSFHPLDYDSPWPLRNLPQLRQLSVLGYVGDAQLEQLSELKDLEVLGFYEAQADKSRITGAFLKAGLTNLTELMLSLTMVGDEEMKLVKNMKRLKSLRLSATKITDAGCEQLKDLVELKVLNLEQTLISDLSLRHLEGMKNLMFLSLMNTKVTDVGVEQLKKVLPSCRINR